MRAVPIYPKTLCAGCDKACADKYCDRCREEVNSLVDEPESPFWSFLRRLLKKAGWLA